MQQPFAISGLVEVKACGIRLAHTDRVVNRFTRNRLLYAVQFPDNWIGYFERWELEKVVLGEAAGEEPGKKSFLGEPK